VSAKRIKVGRHKSYPNGGEDDELVIVAGPPLRHLRHRDNATVLDIAVERARHGESRRLLAGLLDKVHPGLISEVLHVVVAPPDALLLCIHHVRGHSHNISNDRRPSAQEFMASQ
jgi:hypothetical protein